MRSWDELSIGPRPPLRTGPTGPKNGGSGDLLVITHIDKNENTNKKKNNNT